MCYISCAPRNECYTVLESMCASDGRGTSNCSEDICNCYVAHVEHAFNVNHLFNTYALCEFSLHLKRKCDGNMNIAFI